MSKKVTIRDIADKAGVSVATVSFVMNNQASSGSERYRVSPKTTERILQIAAEMNYRPNSAAKSLRSGRTNTIGVVVSDISNKFFADIARCIEDVAYQSNYTVFFGSTDESPEKLQHVIDGFIDRGIDGLIVVPCENSKGTIRKVLDAGIPLVMLDRGVDGVEADCVTLNNRRAAAMAAQHLIDRGARKVEMVNYTMNLQNLRDREAGYAGVMAELGMGESAKVHRVRFRNIPGQMPRVVEDMLSRGVDGIIFTTNKLLRAGVHCLYDIDPVSLGGVRVVGFGESDFFGMCSLPVSYVKQPVELLGSEAVRLLLDNINNRKQQFVSVVLNPILTE